MSEIASASSHISDDELEAAILAGVFDRGSAEKLRAFVIARRQGSNAGADEENLRFLSSFNDIFVTLGVLLCCGAAFSLVSYIGSAIVAWCLALYFTRVRRMALSSIVLLAVFVGSIAAWVFTILRVEFLMPSGRFSDVSHVVMASTALLGATSLHWYFFRVPITIAVGAGIAVMSLLSITAATSNDPNFILQNFHGLMLLCGLGVLTLAIIVDTTDTARITRRSDIAFWLHMLAAPLIVHPVVRGLGLWGGQLALSQALSILGLFALFSSFALILDRRALLVSSLVYLGTAFFFLIDQSKTYQNGPSISLAVLLVGATVLSFSAFWRQLRATILRLLPSFIRALVPAAATA